MIGGNEKEWLRSFYRGSILIKGWNDRMKELLSGLKPEDKARVSDPLEALGAKIGPEWARDNRVRKIDNDQLRVWGESLLSAKKQGPDYLMAEIEKIDAEANRILD